MSTFICLQIQSENRAQIADILQKLSGATEITTGPYPSEHYDNTLIGENDGPSFICVGGTRNGWTLVELNSFNKLHTWVAHLSKELNSTVIQLIAQTTSDVYYFLAYEKGVFRREIEVYHGDYDQTIDKGAKYPFENPNLVPQEDDDEDFEPFDIDTLEAYCRQFGFELMEDDREKQYIILKKKIIGYTIKDSMKYRRRPVGNGKPWWKFW